MWVNMQHALLEILEIMLTYNSIKAIYLRFEGSLGMEQAFIQDCRCWLD